MSAAHPPSPLRSLPISWICLALVAATACGPTRPAERPPVPLDEVLRPSMRGEDEIARPPVSPSRRARRPSGFSWEGPRGRRALRGWPKESVSVGGPSSGRLEQGYELPSEGPGFCHRGERPFGTDELIAVVLWALHRVQRHYPDTVRAVIGDLSEAGGGRAPPHRSHQSGRDVDMSFYVEGNRPIRRFVTVDAGTLDAEKTWALFEGLLSTGMVQYLFVSYELQRPLYEEAQRTGWSEADLDLLFQYPRGKGEAKGLVRHARGHDDHFHLRIRCPVEDEGCVP